MQLHETSAIHWLVAVGMLFLAASQISKAQVGNDQCNGATSLSSGSPYTMSTTGATSTGDPVPTCQSNFGKGVWFKYTPSGSGPVTISTCGSSFDTVLQVYTGTCASLTPVICDDDNGPACSGVQASVSFFGSAGTNYLIMAGGYNSNSGTLVIEASVANDQCSGAIAMTSGVIYSQSTADATSTGDPTPACQPTFGKGVWYTFTPSSSGTATISTCGSSFDTVLAVYTGSCGALTPVACNDDNGPSCSGLLASVQFTGTAGTTYSILAGGYNGASGTLQIVATQPPVEVAIQHAGTNVGLSWPTDTLGFNLQAATNLTAASWSNVTNGANIVGTNYSVTLDATDQIRFFRLKR